MTEEEELPIIFARIDAAQRGQPRTEAALRLATCLRMTGALVRAIAEAV